MPRKKKALKHLDNLAKIRRAQRQARLLALDPNNASYQSCGLDGQIKNEPLASTSSLSSSLSQANIGDEEEDHFHSKRETSYDEDGGGVEVTCKLEVEQEESGDVEEDELIEQASLEEQSILSPEDEPGRSRQRNVLASRDPLATSPSPPEAEDDDDDGGDLPISACLLCAGRITQDRRGRSSYPGYSAKDKDFLVMFVLKKMLRLPNEKLEKYLRLFGHPREWVSFCTSCLPSVKCAFGIQKEINKLEDKLSKFQQEMKTQISLSYVKNEKEVISATAAALSEEKQREDPLLVTRETWCYVVYDARVKPGPKPNAPVSVSNPGVILVPTYFILNPNPNNCVPSISPATVHQTEDTGTTLSTGTSNPTSRSKRRKQELTPSSLRSQSEGVAMRLKTKEDHNSDKNSYDTKWCTKLRFKDTNSVFNSAGYTCPLCPDLKRMKVDSFVKHIIYHKGRPYKCSECGIFLTGSEVELGKIPKLKHDGVPEDHSCTKDTIVPVTFHPGSIWECGRCDKSFNLEEERKAHEMEAHFLQETDIELPYECSWCSGCKFRDYIEWRLHRALEHPELARVACFHCDELVAIKTKEGMDFEDNLGRIVHIRERHGPNARPPYSSQCFICGKVLKLEADLKEHVVQCHGLDRNQCLSCPVCFARLSRGTSLRSHIRSVHSVTTKNKKICKNETSSRSRSADVTKIAEDEISDASISDTADDDRDPVDDSCDDSDCGDLSVPDTVQNARDAFQDRLADVELEATPATRVIKKDDNYDRKWATKVMFKKSALHWTVYTCPLCPDLSVMRLDSFVKHIIYHKARPYKCSICGIFLTGSEMELSKIPKRSDQKEGVPEDHVCTKATMIPAEFQPGDIWECGFCEETFCLEEERSAHEKDVHGQIESSIKLLYECSWCSGSKFRDYVEWRLHRALVHPEQANLACFYCDEIFSIKTKGIVDFEDVSRRTKHIKGRHGPTVPRLSYLVECSMCGENFSRQPDLQVHMEQEHGVDRMRCRSCPLCFSRFQSTQSLLTHMDCVHFSTSKLKRKWICDICGYENAARTQFWQHRLMKHGIEPEDGCTIYSCTEAECNFKCTVKKTLEIHKMKAHNAPRRLKCEFCGKGFLNTAHLSEHRKIHLNATNKPFQCEICGNSFALRNYLYIHMRLSHQNRPFASTHKKRSPRRSNKFLSNSMATGVHMNAPANQ